VPDPRIEKLADVIVRYSTGVKKDQLVRLTGDPVALPLMEAIYERCVQAGAHVQFKCVPDSLSTVFFEHAKPHQLDYVSPLSKQEVKTIDVSIGIWAETNTKAMSNVDPKKQARASAARKPVFKTFMKRAADGDLKWCGTLFPTNASAQDAEMSLREYEDFVFRAGLLHKRDPVAEWKKVAKQQQKVVDYLTGKKEIRFVTKAGTDLLVNVDGMTWINCDGHENFPDGEVFTGPNRRRHGQRHRLLQLPGGAWRARVRRHRLEFRDGRVVDATAERRRGVPHRHARPGRRRSYPGRDRRRHQLLGPAVHEEHAVRREDRRHVPRGRRRRPTPRRAARTNRASTGTWSATCVKNLLADGSEVTAVWSWIKSRGIAKLVTVYFGDDDA
jgi:aminopeptidase